jgi:hypothetical protein
VDLVSRLEMILRGKVSNIGAPVAYSAWNLPPPKVFTSFVSNPPAGDSGLGLRVRPSPEEVSALVASLGEVPDDERQVHFEVPLNPSDAEISAMLDMLAEDSSDVAPAETLAVAPIPEADKDLGIQRSDSVRLKHLRRATQPTSPAEGKKGDPNGCNLGDANPNGCAVRIVNEDEEEEDEIPLVRKNSRHYIASGESSGVPSPTLSALIGLQELSLANFDQTLEDMVPEDLLSEPTDGGMMDICADVPDAGLELS